jgi:hypothetical protein
MSWMSLVIRPEQMEILREVGLQTWLRRYLTDAYPEKTSHIGNLDGFIDESVKRARVRGFTVPNEVRKYVHVAFLLGLGFEDRYGWAAQLLADPDYHSPLARLRVLEDATLEHLQATARAKTQSA